MCQITAVTEERGLSGLRGPGSRSALVPRGSARMSARRRGERAAALRARSSAPWLPVPAARPAAAMPRERGERGGGHSVGARSEADRRPRVPTAAAAHGKEATVGPATPADALLLLPAPSPPPVLPPQPLPPPAAAAFVLVARWTWRVADAAAHAAAAASRFRAYPRSRSLSARVKPPHMRR